MKKCINYEKLEGDTLQCQTCSHFCRIKEGQVGICGIRQNIKGELFLLAYGRAVAAHVDPVEKKPLFHFLPGTLAYSLGTLGCNFRCGNCQNFDISQMFGHKGQVKKYGRLNWGYSLSPEEIIDEAIKNKCTSVAYTYNEPTIWLEYALDTMKLARKSGLKNIWVSNGFMSSRTLDVIVPYLDAINVDIKSFDDDFYQSNCGAGVAPVLENCKRLAKEKIWLEVTTLVIPTLSDDEKMLRKIAQFVKKELGEFVPWHVSAFSGAISWKLQNLPDTPVEKIKRAYDIGKKEGLKYVYAGNVWDRNLESTYCSKCGELVIERTGYEVTRYDKDGKCPKCGEKIEGIF
ncbi:MAG: AmmeMemoRadiSam system radical SAM enzyme [Candidatus Moranbacteria bacterium]|nr:AmmeMemoRadiSam system radical SAM enzyme [Candidatus Moranbacteria bacterium]